MTTVSVTTCDRCGKEISDMGRSHVQIWVPYVRTTSPDNRLDLCPECELAFHGFLASKEPVEPVEPEEGTFAWVLKDMPDDGTRSYKRKSCTSMSMHMFRGQLLPDNLYHQLILSVDDIKADDWYVCRDLSEIQEPLEEASEKKPWFCKRRERE